MFPDLHKAEFNSLFTLIPKLKLKLLNTGPWESISNRWIPLHRASDAQSEPTSRRHNSNRLSVASVYASRIITITVDSLWPSDAIIRHITWSSLVWETTCQFLSSKPLPESFLNYCPLDSEEKTPINLKTYHKTFYSTKYIWKCRLQNVGHFVSTSMC